MEQLLLKRGDFDGATSATNGATFDSNGSTLTRNGATSERTGIFLEWFLSGHR
ncbi:hypothetical protein QS257_05520 [Terrilactibacillus sp. S3-3]|nr:hypothetical protein QS257_05520 [Terrilactibacillus sp. S3-3]